MDVANNTLDTTSATQAEVKGGKKVNPTWEAFGKCPAAFTYVAL